jgi:hypothetical protein
VRQVGGEERAHLAAEGLVFGGKIETHRDERPG